jgi:serine/threonine protein kinase
MPDSDPSPELHGLDPGELLARAMQTARPSSGTGVWTPPTPEEVARLLPQYRIESLIGRGGMGAVYKGVQLTLDRTVAIKLLPAEIAADAQFVTRFQREARTLARLQHSRIVTIHDSGQTSEGHLYFVMEYIDGTDLRSILRGPGLDPEQALAVVGQLCDALQAAHREGIVHRDIKPENVLITRDGYVKLADFGLARPPQEADTPNLTNTNVVMGTPDYMAPEQRSSATKADHRSDIFALGVMLYEMLTGQTPRGVFDPPSRKVQMDVRIDEVVLKALQSEPDRRYQKASEMKTDMDRIRSTPPGGTRAVVPEAPASGSAGLRAGSARNTTERVPPWIVAVLAVLLGIIGFLIWKSTHPQTSIASTSEPREILVVAPSATPAPSTPRPAPQATPVPAAIVANATPIPQTTPTPSPATPMPVVVQSPPLPVTPPPVATPGPVPSLLPTFSKQIPNISAWVLAPLEQSVPADIRQNLTFLREDIADEAKQKSAADRVAYNVGYQLCNTLLAVLDERTQAQARAGFRGVEANARTGVTSQALEARRNYMMSWPQYARETSQRAELKSQAVNNAAVMAERPKLEWSQRAAQLSKTLDSQYAQFRAALRQSPAVK